MSCITPHIRIEKPSTKTLVGAGTAVVFRGNTRKKIVNLTFRSEQMRSAFCYPSQPLYLSLTREGMKAKVGSQDKVLQGVFKVHQLALSSVLLPHINGKVSLVNEGLNMKFSYENLNTLFAIVCITNTNKYVFILDYSRLDGTHKLI